MSYYHHRFNSFARTKKWRYFHLAFVGVVGVLIILGGFYAYYLWHETAGETLVDKSGPVRTEIVQPAFSHLHESDFFTFRSSEVWTFSKEDSQLPVKLIYKDMNHTLVERILTVYLGTVPPDTGVTYLTPVVVRENANLLAGQMSDKCSKYTISKNPTVVTFQGVQFRCIPDSSAMIIAAGTAGKGYNIPLTVNGNPKNVGMVYQDVTFKGDPTLFTEIINSFKLK